jgi:hypothetical protein
MAIAAGGAHSLGLRADGSIAAWGDNEYGQCNVPSPNSDFAAIAAGTAHSLGLKQGVIDLGDLIVFCSHWLEQDCNVSNWCEGTDRNQDNMVDFIDFALLAENWLYQQP